MEQKSKPALLLLPNLLATGAHPELFLPASVNKAVNSLDGLIAENPTAGKRYLDLFIKSRDTRTIPIAVVDKSTAYKDIDFFLEPILNGERWGYVSDAGLPCIADPGSQLVFRARQRGITVQAFVGPSALLLGLMLSGLPSQSFGFSGYLPKKKEDRESALKQLEKRSLEENSTQLFIEAPHRNRILLEDAIKVLSPDTWLCVASQLTTLEQTVICQQVVTWRKAILPQIDGKAVTFYLYAKKDLYS
ncbi:MAG: SAM-dependent methyltransferase [Parachlamydiales bacterium]|jgi:16S rRNA (cytidine1402-2'-O)-methyltransferase